MEGEKKHKMKIKNEKGFTLIELMVVLVIIIVVIGLGIAAYFANLPHLRFTSATRDFVNNLRMAQQIAAKENSRVRVTFRTTTSYEVVKIVGDQDPIGFVANDVTIKTVDIGAQYKNTVQLQTPLANNNIVFGRLGAVDTSTFTFTTIADPNCPSEFMVGIERSDGSEARNVCINNSGRIRLP